MSLEVHHLQLSQSERIVWLLEELKIPYKLVIHERDPRTALAPESLKSISPAGTAPYFEDKSVSPPVSLLESGAIVQYILEKYGPISSGPRLSRGVKDSDFAAYVEYLHFSNASLQPTIGRLMVLNTAGLGSSDIYKRFESKVNSQMKIIDDQLSKTKWLAGNELSAADIMMVFSLTTMRGFAPFDIGAYKNILRYLQDVAARPAYQEALKKGDNGMKPMNESNTRKFTQFESVRKMFPDSADK